MEPLRIPGPFPSLRFESRVASRPRPGGRGMRRVEGPAGLPGTRESCQLLPAFSVGSVFPPSPPPGRVCGRHPGWAHGPRKVNTQPGSDRRGLAWGQLQAEAGLKVRNAAQGAFSRRGQRFHLGQCSGRSRGWVALAGTGQPARRPTR